MLANLRARALRFEQRQQIRSAFTISELRQVARFVGLCQQFALKGFDLFARRLISAVSRFDFRQHAIARQQHFGRGDFFIGDGARDFALIFVVEAQRNCHAELHRVIHADALVSGKRRDVRHAARFFQRDAPFRQRHVAFGGLQIGAIAQGFLFERSQFHRQRRGTEFARDAHRRFEIRFAQQFEQHDAGLSHSQLRLRYRRNELHAFQFYLQ